MPCMGPGSPTENQVEETLDLVLELLRDKHGCLKHSVPKWPNALELRMERIDNLRKAIYGMIELEYWEAF